MAKAFDTGRNALKRIVEITGCTNVRSVSIHAEVNDVVRMNIERFVTTEEIDALLPIVEGMSIKSSTTIEVDPCTRVTFEV